METNAAIIAASIAIGAVIIACVLGSRRDCATNKAKETRGHTLLTAASQWAEAARADSDPLGKLVHSAYASAYFHAARAILADDELEESSTVKVAKFSRTVEQQQRKAIGQVRQLMAAGQAKPFEFEHADATEVSSSSKPVRKAMPYRAR